MLFTVKLRQETVGDDELRNLISNLKEAFPGHEFGFAEDGTHIIANVDTHQLPKENWGPCMAGRLTRFGYKVADQIRDAFGCDVESVSGEYTRAEVNGVTVFTFPGGSGVTF